MLNSINFQIKELNFKINSQSHINECQENETNGSGNKRINIRLSELIREHENGSEASAFENDGEEVASGNKAEKDLLGKESSFLSEKISQTPIKRD